MVARYKYDGLGRWVERGIDGEAPNDPDGVDVYRHFFDDEGWQVVGTRWNRSKGLRWSWAGIEMRNPG